MVTPICGNTVVPLGFRQIKASLDSVITSRTERENQLGVELFPEARSGPEGSE
jgi:hypothetical protein